MRTYLITAMAMYMITCAAFGATPKPKGKRKPAGTGAADVSSPSSGAKPQAGPVVDEGEGYMIGSSTKIDFSETTIDGKMKAPDGFFLQGHNSNSLSQMVKLRNNFRSDLRNSRSAVKSHVK